MRRGRGWRFLAGALAAVATTATNAQGLRGGVSGLGGAVLGGLRDAGQTVDQTVGQTVGQTIDRTTGLVDHAEGALAALDPQALVEQRTARLDAVIENNRRTLERDDAGNPVIRGEVLAISPSPAALQAASDAGFTLKRRETLEDLGVALVVLGAPPHVSAAAAVKRLRRLDPQGAYDFNHLYFGAGVVGGAGGAGAGDDAHAGDAATAQTRVGLVDTGVAAALPVFQGVRIEQRGFAGGAASGQAHGTATASLIAGRLGGFHGAAVGASLVVADIYGGAAGGGTAEALASALAWLAKSGVPVINVSLVGPANRLVGAVVAAVSARGSRIVAAVGNDGPAAPPAYPASYPQVIAVTAVDARGRVLPEAGRALHVDYAAPGAGLDAAALGGGLTAVRGTSFAAPIVAGELARLLLRQDPDAAANALLALDREARPAGGRTGHGLVGAEVRFAAARGVG